MDTVGGHFKLTTSPVKLEPIHTRGRFVEPKLFVGFQNDSLKLMLSRSQSFTSKLSRISSRQHDHLPLDQVDGRPRPKFALFGEQFFNPSTEIKEMPVINSSRNNDSKSSRITRSVNHTPSLGSDFVLEPALRSQRESRSPQRKYQANPTVLHPIPLELLTKSRHGNASPSEGSSKTRLRRKKTSSLKVHPLSQKSESMQVIFRSSTIHIDGSTLPWN